MTKWWYKIYSLFSRTFSRYFALGFFFFFFAKFSETAPTKVNNHNLCGIILGRLLLLLPLLRSAALELHGKLEFIIALFSINQQSMLLTSYTQTSCNQVQFIIATDILHQHCFCVAIYLHESNQSELFALSTAKKQTDISIFWFLSEKIVRKHPQSKQSVNKSTYFFSSF